jgi:hypothetical protein
VLIAVAGPEAAFLLNALSFVAVLWVLFRWNRLPTASTLPAERLLGAMRAGVRYVRYAPPFRAVLVRSAAFVSGAAVNDWANLSSQNQGASWWALTATQQSWAHGIGNTLEGVGVGMITAPIIAALSAVGTVTGLGLGGYAIYNAGQQTNNAQNLTPSQALQIWGPTIGGFLGG